MIGADTGARRAAIDWAIRAHDPAFEDWAALEDWLAANPEHAVLYDLATVGADEAARVLRTRPDEVTVPRMAKASYVRTPRRWFPLALAASLLVTVGGSLVLFKRSSEPMLYSVATAAGKTRTLDHVGAVRIDLNGDTQVTLDRKNPRFARLDRGEAIFTVVHDPGHPFALRVGAVVVTDVGTVFDVEQGVDGVQVSVAEGEVRVGTPNRSLGLNAGQSVLVGHDSDAMIRSVSEADSVGRWREGQIDFADATLGQLAMRLHRSTGAKIQVSPDVAARRVTGSLRVAGNREEMLGGLGAVLGISVHRDGDGWKWSGRARATPS